MMKNFTVAVGEVLLFLQIFSSAISPASGYTIKGTIKDVQTKEPLPFTNVIPIGTSMGASSDINGNYIIQDIPPGKYTILRSYIGYKSEETIIKVAEDRTIKHDFNLKAEGIINQHMV